MGFLELILSLALLPSPGAGPTLAARDFAEGPGLVALLQLRRESLPHALKAEIFPVALVRGDSFLDARVGGVHPFTGETDRTLPGRPSPLEEFRDFTVYYQGAPIGGFRVTGIESAIYSCRAVRIGVGEMDLPDGFVRFGRLDPRVHTFAISGAGFAYEYALNYYVALAHAVPQPGFAWDSLADGSAVRRLQDALWDAGAEALERLGAADPRWSYRERFRTFDLDRDGRPEAVAVVEAAAPRRAGGGADGGLPAPVSATVWAADRGADAAPAILAVLTETDPSSREDYRRHLTEVMDLTGDGVAELVYQIDGFEVHGFSILRLEGDALVEAFAGGEYGC